MSGLPVISGAKTFDALSRLGCIEADRKGSSVRSRHPSDPFRPPLTTPDHRELESGAPRAIIRDAGLTIEQIGALLKD